MPYERGDPQANEPPPASNGQNGRLPWVSLQQVVGILETVKTPTSTVQTGALKVLTLDI